MTTLYIWWNHIKFWNFCFQLHFLVRIHTEALTYWIIASQKTANVNTFLHYHASACTSFGQVCHIHYIRYNPISCTIHPTKGWLASFVNITLDIVGSHRLFQGTTYQSLNASFQITFSYPSPCVVLILVPISSKLSKHYFSVH